MSNKIEIASAVIENNQKRSLDNLEDGISSFIIKVNEILAKRDLQGPKVGIIYTTDSAKIFKSNDKKPEHTNSIIDIKKVEIKFENGQIGGIKVSGIINESIRPVIFHNRIPISYSTKSDVSGDYIGNINKRVKLYSSYNDKANHFLFLDEILYNDYVYNNYSENYSPKDTVLIIRPFEPGRILYKEKVVDLVQARIFTDLLGYGNENPNGLVQAEISIKIFLRTKPVNLTTKSGSFGKRFFHIVSINYLIPSISLTKTERDNKFYPAPSIGIRIDSLNSNGENPTLISTMDLFKYASFFSGEELNIFKFGAPNMHSVLHLNIGGHLILTGIEKNTTVEDAGSNFLFSFADEINVASIYISPVIVRWDINPHPNYRVYLSYHLNRLYTLDSRIKQIEEGKSRYFHQLSFMSALKFNEDANGELFFRSRLSMMHNNRNNIFFQTQIGYSFKIFTGTPETKNRAVFHDVF